MRRKIRTLLHRNNRNGNGGGLAVQLRSVGRPPAENTQCPQPTAAPSISGPSSSLDVTRPATLDVPTPATTPAPDSPCSVQGQPEQHVAQAPDRPEPPQPYAKNSDLWNEALEALPEPEMRELIEEHIGTQSHNVKSLAGDIQSKIDAAFKSQQHDSRASRAIENAVSVLSQFTSAVDVAINFDPFHAAVPWAFVRSVIVFLASGSELKNHLLAGMAMVASLLVQCDTYQQLYMAPDLVLRPPEAQLGKLKESVVLAYAKSQTLLVATIQQWQSKTRHLAAPFKLSGIQTYVNELAKCEKQLVRIAEDCEKFCNSSLRSNARELQTLKDSFHRIIQDQIKLVLDTISDKEQREMLEWISPILYGKHHARIKEARTPDTCDWLLAHEKFREWEGASSSMILWLQGSPGAGKTFLASKVIDYIRTRPQDSANQEGFAFFYCNRNEEQRRNPLSILQSFVRQLSTTIEKPACIRKQLQDLCSEKRLNGSDLSSTDCIEQLVESVSLYDQTTLVLDALDECEPGSRRTIMEAIELLFKSGSSVKVFISSRPDRDIRNRFAHRPNIEIRATHTKKDIHRFTNTEISKHENWADMRPNLRERIISTVFTKGQGMFQWVFLQIKEILLLETEAAILDRLGKLPADLKTAYDEIYENIKARHKHDRALADNALKWVAAACRPLKSDELLSMIRLDYKETFYLHEAINESQLLHLCNNILVLDDELNVWRFSHLSVAEYFENNHWSLVKAHRHCASVCLKALLSFHPRWCRNSNWSENSGGEEESVYEVTKSSDNKNIQERQLDGILSSDHRLQGYARRNWMTHIEAQEIQEVDPDLAKLLESFLGAPGKSSLQYREWFNKIERDRIYIDDISPASIALFAMYRFSFRNILHNWWEDPKLDLSQTNSKGLNALAIAAKHGHKQNCEALIELGIDVNLNLETRCGSALGEAVAAGRARIVKFLIKKGGANVDLHLRGDYGSALAIAAFNGETEVMEYLIKEAGAGINLQLLAGDLGSALAAAAAAVENFETVQFLVQAGADINQQLQVGRYGSALATAAAHGRFEVIQFLVQAGADINQQLQVGRYGSALIAAAAHGEFEPIQFLVQAGADINQQAQVGRYGSALIAAATDPRGYKAIQFFIQAGVNINQQPRVGGYGSALAAAAAGPYKNLRAIKCLIQAGVDINQQLQVGSYGSALIAAVVNRRYRAVELLIQAGADVNQQPCVGDYGSALAAAAAAEVYREQLKSIETLVQAGVNINQQLRVGRYGSALAAAAVRSRVRLEKVMCLVQVGADINLPLLVGDYSNALAAAIVENATNGVEYLAQHAEADVNQQIPYGKYGGSALAIAAYWGRAEYIDILIEAGAKVNLEIENGPFRTALQAAQRYVPKATLEEGRYRRDDMDELEQNKARVAELLRHHGAVEAQTDDYDLSVLYM